MAWILRLILGTGTAALGALLAMMFQGEIARYFNPDRLVADLYVSPWQSMAVSAGDPGALLQMEGFGDYDIGKLTTGDPLALGEILLKNPGAKTVTDIRFNLTNLSVDAIAAFKDQTLVEKSKGNSVVQIGSLKPGESVKIFFWATTDPTFSYPFESIETYSSQGPAIVHFHQFKNATFNDWDEDFIGSVIGWVFGLSVVALFILLLILAGYFSTYIGQLIKDEDWYLQERARHDAAPKKFTPRLKEAT